MGASICFLNRTKDEFVPAIILLTIQNWNLEENSFVFILLMCHVCSYRNWRRGIAHYDEFQANFCYDFYNFIYVFTKIIQTEWNIFSAVKAIRDNWSIKILISCTFWFSLRLKVLVSSYGFKTALINM